MISHTIAGGADITVDIASLTIFAADFAFLLGAVCDEIVERLALEAGCCRIAQVTIGEDGTAESACEVVRGLLVVISVVAVAAGVFQSALLGRVAS